MCPDPVGISFLVLSYSAAFSSAFEEKIEKLNSAPFARNNVILVRIWAKDGSSTAQKHKAHETSYNYSPEIQDVLVC